MRITNLEGWIDFVDATPYTAAGGTTITSAEIDTGADFDSVLVLAKFGTPAANNTLSLTSSETSGGAFEANGVVPVPSDANTHVALRVERMKERYIRTVATRGTASTIEYVIVIPYSSKAGLRPPPDWTTTHSFAGFDGPTA